jgi:hypothetical protein
MPGTSTLKYRNKSTVVFLCEKLIVVIHAGCVCVLAEEARAQRDMVKLGCRLRYF